MSLLEQIKDLQIEIQKQFELLNKPTSYVEQIQTFFKRNIDSVINQLNQSNTLNSQIELIIKQCNQLIETQWTLPFSLTKEIESIIEKNKEQIEEKLELPKSVGDQIVNTIRNNAGPVLEEFRLKHLVRKGTLQGLVEELRSVPADEKPLVGKELNALKALAEGEYERLQKSFEKKTAEKKIDVTLPGRNSETGHVHLITQTLEELKRIFAALGFRVEEGPEIEDDYHNFEALNFAPDHPARDMQDTFHIDDPAGKYILRTHTSPGQVRVMEHQKPPIRVIVPGRVYRNEAISARSYSIFHQVEGLVVDEGVTFAELQGTLFSFAKQFYGEKSVVRFRPSYFPFTEPSAEMDVTCYLCGGKGCRVCKGTGWLEILGCGMVHPNVLRNVNIDPEKYTGYAFGIGIERTAMLRSGIDDIRLLYENDLRVLKQF